MHNSYKIILKRHLSRQRRKERANVDWARLCSSGLDRSTISIHNQHPPKNLDTSNVNQVIPQTWVWYAKFQNTRPLLCISLNTKSAYCVIPRSSKRSDKCKWCGRGILKLLQKMNYGSRLVLLNSTEDYHWHAIVVFFSVNRTLNRPASAITSSLDLLHHI